MIPNENKTKSPMSLCKWRPTKKIVRRPREKANKLVNEFVTTNDEDKII